MFWGYIRLLRNKVGLKKRTILSKTKVINNGFCFQLKKEIYGNNNTIIIGSGSVLMNCSIRIYGNNCRIIIGKNWSFGKNTNFWVDGNDVTIELGNNVTTSRDVQFCAQETNSRIVIGDDCMFSNNIIIRTSDSHPIYSISKHERINPPGNVIIGKHVWIAPNSKIFKGVVVEEGAVIGSNSLVTHDIMKNSLAVGTPAKCIKNDIMWTREDIFE